MRLLAAALLFCTAALPIPAAAAGRSEDIDKRIKDGESFAAGVPHLLSLLSDRFGDGKSGEVGPLDSVCRAR